MAAQIGLSTLTATIQAGQSLSPQIDIGPGILVGLLVPANWTNATSITFQGSPDGGVTWGNLFNYDYAEWIIGTNPGVFNTLDPTQWRAVRSLMLRSGTSGQPVAQTNTVNVSLIVSL
jgi:hypothetical protein